MTRPRCTPPDRGRPPIAREARREPDQVVVLRGGLAAEIYAHRVCGGCGKPIRPDGIDTRCSRCRPRKAS